MSEAKTREPVQLPTSISTLPDTLALESQPAKRAVRPQHGAGRSTIRTDSFNRCELEPSAWSYHDPFAGGADASLLKMTTTQLQIDIPAGVVHTLWNGKIGVPHLKQPANDVDFDLEIRLDSAFDSAGCMQGLLLLSDARNFAYAAVRHDGQGVRLTGGVVNDGQMAPAFDVALAAGAAPLYLRVQRTGDVCIVWSSFDGFDWSDSGGATRFEASFVLTEIALFAGAGEEGSAFSALFDYIFNAHDDIDPNDLRALRAEDILARDAIEPDGVGKVELRVLPPQNGAACGPVELRAVPTVPGWEFDGWQSLSFESAENPLVRDFAFGDQVVAGFRWVDRGEG